MAQIHPLETATVPIAGWRASSAFGLGRSEPARTRIAQEAAPAGHGAHDRNYDPETYDGVMPMDGEPDPVVFDLPPLRFRD
mgnify:CR=1 FL=1